LMLDAARFYCPCAVAIKSIIFERGGRWFLAYLYARRGMHERPDTLIKPPRAPSSDSIL
jgi:hypothetical protein